MLAATDRRARKQPVGSPTPRVAPPLPAKTAWREFRDLAAELGLTLFPWQETAAKYLTATNAAGQPLYREVCVIVARRNGKTTLLLPLIVSRLLDGQKITHAAHQLRMPDEMFRAVVAVFEDHYPAMIPKKRGVSWRAGQEELRLTNGGSYQPIASGNGAARGLTNDVVIIDELREITDIAPLSALKPTTRQSAKRQMIYLSNAGTADSVALKSVQVRAGQDEALAYLEWSAAPERKPDDLAGWLEANPAIGHNPAILEGLYEDYRAALLSGTMPEFEVESLCREQITLAERLVTDETWAAQDFAGLGRPTRAYMGIGMDPSSERASAVIAWKDADGRICLDVHDTKGSPIDPDRLGPDLQRLASNSRVAAIAFDPYTDLGLMRHLRNTTPIRGQVYSQASGRFRDLADERKFRVRDPDGILAEDLRWTTRRYDQLDTFKAVKADAEHPNTAATAAIRAVWLATQPNTVGPLRMF